MKPKTKSSIYLLLCIGIELLLYFIIVYSITHYHIIPTENDILSIGMGAGIVGIYGMIMFIPLVYGIRYANEISNESKPQPL